MFEVNFNLPNLYRLLPAQFFRPLENNHHRKPNIMAVNILEELLKKFNLSALKKVDPNTQKVEVKTDEEREHKLIQALAPAAVAGIYDAARSEEGLSFLAGTAGSPDWLSLLFGNNAPEVKQRIADYTSNSTDAVQTHFNSVAAEAVNILRTNATGDDKKISVRDLVGSQRDWFLPFLPAELKIGSLLEDNTMDDRMNKMEGPVSSFMHKVETVFTGQESKEAADSKRDKNM